jgi:hypothetical protein
MQKPLIDSNMFCIRIIGLNILASLPFYLNLKIPHKGFSYFNHFKRSVHHTCLTIRLTNLFHQMHDSKDSYMLKFFAAHTSLNHFQLSALAPHIIQQVHCT